MKLVIELLAPAGSRESLIAAVESGANAVYLGGKMFGARHYAQNFSDEDMAAMVRYCHLRNVRVYITVNTLVDDSEIPELIRYLQFLYVIAVDAVIVQDPGVARIARNVAPSLPLHASTQMTIHNLAGVQFVAGLGFKRAVLARELSLSDIEYISKNAPIEIETFVHGALCICYSGQCLMSGMIGGRSGNRGRCAQPCRLTYSLVNDAAEPLLSNQDAGEYLLSPKDLNTIEILPDLLKAGVTSLKIEGRMKRPEYVAVVVDAYRRAIDQYLALGSNGLYSVSAQDRKDLAQIFNRDFTTAYLQGKQGSKMMSDRRPNNRGLYIGRVSQYQFENKAAHIKLEENLNTGDIIEFWVKVGGRVNVTVKELKVNGQNVDQALAGQTAVIALPGAVRNNDRVFKVYDCKLMDRAKTFFTRSEAVRRIPVDITVRAAVGEPITIALQDADGFTGRGATDFIGEAARNRPLTQDSIAKQAAKLGSTIFAVRKLVIDINGNVMAPVSEINEARRRAVEALETARLAQYERSPLPAMDFRFNNNTSSSPRRRGQKPKLAVHVDTLEKVQAAIHEGADSIWFGGESFAGAPFTSDNYRKVIQLGRKAGKKVIFNTPRIIQEWQVKDFVEQAALFNELQPDAVGVGNIGTIQLLKDLTDLPLLGDYPLNVYNSSSLAFFHEQGLAGLTLSPELNLEQISLLAAQGPGELTCLIHGYITLMISQFCAAGGYLGGLDRGQCSRPCKKQKFGLKDRLGEVFPLATDQFCRMHILNAKELSMLPHIPKFQEIGVGFLRIEGKYASVKDISTHTRLYRELIDQGEQHPLFKHNTFGELEHGNITRGHYFRGVL